jgi:hypothetical protein
MIDDAEMKMEKLFKMKMAIKAGRAKAESQTERSRH